MNATPDVWDHLERRVQQRITNHKRRHTRYWKLRGQEAKTAVLQGAVARLMTPDAVFPYALRKRLALRPLVAKGVPAGWLGYWRPISSALWEAWLKLHHQHIERGSFWFEESAATDALIDAAVDAERKTYCSATADSAGPSDGRLDTEALATLSRFTETGDAFAFEPSRVDEEQRREKLEEAALDAREQIEAEENAQLRQAINADPWMRKRPENQLRALHLILFEPMLKGFEIAIRCHVAESTVSKIRANVEALADGILTTPDDEAAPVDAAPTAEVQHDETVTQIAEALHSGAALDLAAAFQAPEVDAEVSEATLHSYARRNSSGAHMRDNWSGGRRRYSDADLVTGSRYGGAWGDPAEIAQRDARKQHAAKFSDAEMRELRSKAAAADVALNGFLRAIDSFLTKRAAESVDNLLGASIRGPKRGRR